MHRAGTELASAVDDHDPQGRAEAGCRYRGGQSAE